MLLSISLGGTAYAYDYVTSSQIANGVVRKVVTSETTGYDTTGDYPDEPPCADDPGMPNKRCFVRLFCGPKFVALGGGWRGVDPGTQMLDSAPSQPWNLQRSQDAVPYAQGTWYIEWRNDDTVDRMTVYAVSASARPIT